MAWFGVQRMYGINERSRSCIGYVAAQHRLAWQGYTELMCSQSAPVADSAGLGVVKVGKVVQCRILIGGIH